MYKKPYLQRNKVKGINLKTYMIKCRYTKRGRTMEYANNIDEIVNQIQAMNGLKTATIVKYANKVYTQTIKHDPFLLASCDRVMQTNCYAAFVCVTIWIKRRNMYYIENFTYYEIWLRTYTDSWAKCDILCYRIINPMIEQFPCLYDHVKTWCNGHVYMKRAAAVCMIHSANEFTVNVPFAWVYDIASTLLEEPHIHVKKGIGWLLKYAYLTYPEETLQFLIEKQPDRVIYRYALEKVPEDIRKQYMRKTKASFK